MIEVELTLNGRRSKLHCGSAEMLLGVLRREAGLTSVRATCGVGVCGACTVLVDGEPMSSCILLAGLVRGRSVSTAEGLAGDDPVVAAFAAERAYQCGFCTPGFMLTAKRLLEEDPEPDEEAIAEALGGNLCRCGSYVKIVEAVRRAARPERAR